MGLTLMILTAYLGLSCLSGIKSLLRFNLSDAPEQQLVFACVYGLSWPLRLFTSRMSNLDLGDDSHGG